MAVKADLLSDQSVRRVVQLIFFAGFVFDFSQQQPRRIVAILQFAAVGVEATADQVQVVGVFIAGGPPQLIALGGDLAVGVVVPGAGRTTRQGGFEQAAHRVPLVVREGAVFVLAGQQTPQSVVGKTPAPRVRQGFFGQLAQLIAGKPMLATVGVTDRQQLSLGVVVIAGALAVRIDGLDHIALGVAPVLPHGLAA